MELFTGDQSDTGIVAQMREGGLKIAFYTFTIGGVMSLLSHSPGTLCRAPSTNFYMLGWGLTTLAIGIGLAAYFYLLDQNDENTPQFATA